MPYDILGTRIDCVDKASAEREIKERLIKNKRTAMFTPNLLMIGRAASPKAENILNAASLNVSDGSGVCLALRYRKIKNAERTAGIDVARSALEFAARQSLRVYLLGGKIGVAERAADKLTKEIEGICICGTHHGYFDLCRDNDEYTSVIADVKRSRADVLIVCLGYPRQEKFITDVFDTLDGVRLFMALGGSLDVWSGEVRRAPALIQRLHLEWLWRCILEPHRFKNACALPVYFIKASLSH